MSRKRIVIDLDGPGATAGGPAARAARHGGTKRRWWPRVLGILLVLMLLLVGVVALVGFFAWRHYQSTPAYTLALMIDAAQHEDVPGFMKRFDDEAIARDMVTAVSEKAAARYGLALSNTVKAQIDSTMPSMLQEIKPAIRDEVAREIQTFAANLEPRPFILLLLGVPSLMTITTEGDTATASAMINNRRVGIAMRRADDGWKVTGFKDDVVIQRVVDRVMAQLPAIGKLEAQLPLVKPRRRSQRRR